MPWLDLQSWVLYYFIFNWLYYNGYGVHQDYAEALRWFRKATEQGDADAQFNLGVMYDNGQGVRQDDAEAFRWFRKAAEQGHAEAQYNLGEMYHIGQGVRQDLHLSKEWFGKACDGGVQEACNQYRYLNQKGYWTACDALVFAIQAQCLNAIGERH